MSGSPFGGAGLGRFSLRIGRFAPRAVLLPLLVALNACGGSGDQQRRSDLPSGASAFTVSMTVSGLDAPVHPDVYFSMTFTDAAGNPGLGIIGANANGIVTFVETVNDGHDYEVKFRDSSDDSLRCTVEHGSGTINAANVSNITALCVPSYTVGGHTVGGSPQLEILHNGVLVPTYEIHYASGDQTFRTRGTLGFLPGDTYSVAVSPQSSQVDDCKVRHGSGVVSNANVTDVEINCADIEVSFSVEGLIGSGLEVELISEVTLANGGTSMLQLETEPADANGEYTFDVLIEADAPYEVRVRTQPTVPDQECQVQNGVGRSSVDVTNVIVRCPTPYRFWRFDDSLTWGKQVPLKFGEQSGGVVYEAFVYGKGPIVPLGSVSGLAASGLFTEHIDQPGANGVVFSNETGQTYWLETESPVGSRDADDVSVSHGNFALLNTHWRFKKVADDTDFRLVLSEINMMLFDDAHSEYSGGTLRAGADMNVHAHLARGYEVTPEPFFNTQGAIYLIARVDQNNTQQTDWDLSPSFRSDVDQALWSKGDFLMHGTPVQARSRTA